MGSVQSEILLLFNVNSVQPLGATVRSCSPVLACAPLAQRSCRHKRQRQRGARQAGEGRSSLLLVVVVGVPAGYVACECIYLDRMIPLISPPQAASSHRPAASISSSCRLRSPGLLFNLFSAQLTIVVLVQPKSLLLFVVLVQRSEHCSG